MQHNHYLYRHIRLDTNEVFYVGIGTKPKSFKSMAIEFSRAYSKNTRNNRLAYGYKWEEVKSCV